MEVLGQVGVGVGELGREVEGGPQLLQVLELQQIGHPLELVGLVLPAPGGPLAVHG